MWGEIAGIILALGTAYNYVITARVAAKQKISTDLIESLKGALVFERDTVSRLSKEIERLQSVIDEYKNYIAQLKQDSDNKSSEK